MTATDLADKASITQTQLSLYESGSSTMGVDKLCRIAEVLKVPLSYLQPKSLDSFSEPQVDYGEVIILIRQLPPEDRRKMIKMFEAQLRTLI